MQFICGRTRFNTRRSGKKAWKRRSYWKQRAKYRANGGYRKVGLDSEHRGTVDPACGDSGVVCCVGGQWRRGWDGRLSDTARQSWQVIRGNAGDGYMEVLSARIDQG